MNLHRAGLAIAVVAILSLLLCIPMLPSKVTLKPGDICPEDIIARKTVHYIDTVETEHLRARAASNVREVYDPVPNANDEAVHALKTIFVTVEEVRATSRGLSAPRKVAKIRERLGAVLGSQISDASFVSLLGVDPKPLRSIEDNSLRLISAIMQNDLPDRPAEMKAARMSVDYEAKKVFGDNPESTIVGEVVKDSLRPNRIYNEDRTLALQERARAGVMPVSKWIERGDRVIGKGETVLPEHIQRLEALGLSHPMIDFRSVLSLTLLVLMMVSIAIAYLWRYHHDVYSNQRALYLLAIIVIVCTLALRLGGSMLGISLLPTQVGYLGLLWIVTASMFMAVLLNPHVSVVITAMLSIVLSLQLNSDLRFAVSALITSLVGIFCVANIRGRNDSFRIAGLLSVANIAMVWIMGTMNQDPLQQMLQGTGWSFVIAVFATFIFWHGIAPLEKPFGVTTHLSLLELADTDKPLIRRLVLEAPGTWAHCMTVGHLAESAAEAIGADALVARVASYYHDIGKIRRPHFFIENQNVENVHDKMNPTLSALVITSHIKDGIDIAREFRVPKVILDIIGEHHGTSLVQYFYHQATGELEPSTMLEQQFRYPGPKPQTKEAAVVMLADSVEAARRGLSKPTPAKIEMLVSRIIADKLSDGQLDECELTFRDLSKITDVFVRTIISIMHARIEYPDSAGNGDRKVSSDADTDTEQSEKAGEGAQAAEHSEAAS